MLREKVVDELSDRLRPDPLAADQRTVEHAAPEPCDGGLDVERVELPAASRIAQAARERAMALLRQRRGAQRLLTGPDALTRAEIARQLSEAVGRPVRYEALSEGVFSEMLRAAGVPPPVVATLSGFYADIRDGRMALATDEVRRITGQPARTFRDFAREHASHFAPSA